MILCDDLSSEILSAGDDFHVNIADQVKETNHLHYENRVAFSTTGQDVVFLGSHSSVHELTSR